MRHLTDEGLALIKRFEGFAPEDLYVCPGGWPTIGYGHVVREHERERFADGIDEAAADELLRRDVETAERAVLRLIRVPLEDGQFDALCFVRLQSRRRRAAALDLEAQGQPGGARRRAGRVRALGVGRWAQAQGAGAAAGGGG